VVAHILLASWICGRRFGRRRIATFLVVPIRVFGQQSVLAIRRKLDSIALWGCLTLEFVQQSLSQLADLEVIHGHKYFTRGTAPATPANIGVGFQVAV